MVDTMISQMNGTRSGKRLGSEWSHKYTTALYELFPSPPSDIKMPTDNINIKSLATALAGIAKRYQLNQLHPYLGSEPRLLTKRRIALYVGRSALPSATPYNLYTRPSYAKGLDHWEQIKSLSSRLSVPMHSIRDICFASREAPHNNNNKYRSDAATFQSTSALFLLSIYRELHLIFDNG